MKPTLLLTPALRTAVTAIVSKLPPSVSIAVGVDVEASEPYFMAIRLTLAGSVLDRKHITFESEQQVFSALKALQQSLGLSETAPAAPKKFADLDNELAAMSITATSVA